MYFTQEDYRKIEAYLKSKAARDTSFDSATTPLQGNETIVLVQGGKNVNTTVSDIVSQFFALGVSDFINVTDKYGISYNTLDEAIRVIPWRSRKVGQVITFLNEQGEWHLYQYQGESILTWNNTTLWVDLLESRIVNSILPDQEDLTMTEPDADGNSYMHFKDKDYSIDDFSGLGRVYLRKNLQTLTDPNTGETRLINYLTQTMVGKENVIYHIQYDYNLNGQTIIIPEGCVLLFEGGSIINGVITGTDTAFEGTINFNQVHFSGVFNLKTIYSRHYTYNNDNDLFKNIAILSGNKYNVIYFENRVYNVSVLEEGDSIFNINSNTKVFLSGEIKLASTKIGRYCIIKITDVDNIELSGGTITGDIVTHTGTTGEWGHCIQLLGGNNIKISNITLKDAWGDGISVDSSLIRLSSNVYISDIVIDRNRRQGISIEGANNIYVDNVKISNIGSISGTAPSAAIDVEPWRDGEYASNIFISNCTSINNKLGFVVHNKVNNINIDNCFSDSPSNVSGVDIKNVHYNNCTLEDYFVASSGDITLNNCNLGILVLQDVTNFLVKNCIIDENNVKEKFITYYATLISANFSNTNISNILIEGSTFNLRTNKLSFTRGNSNIGKSIILKKCSINGATSAGSINISIIDCYDCIISSRLLALNNAKGTTLNFIGNTIIDIGTGESSIMSVYPSAFEEDLFIIAHNIISNKYDRFIGVNGDVSNCSITLYNNISNLKFVDSNSTIFTDFVNRFKVCKVNILDIRKYPYLISEELPAVSFYDKGTSFFNTDNNNIIIWSGNHWVNSDGTRTSKVVIV